LIRIAVNFEVDSQEIERKDDNTYAAFGCLTAILLLPR